MSPDKPYDVLVIGAGPAALSAAIYTTREDLSTVLVEKGVVGGLAAITDKIDNYPGFPDGVTGMDLADALWKQAERFGTKIEYGEVTAVDGKDKIKKVSTTAGEMYAKSVLIATGTDWKSLASQARTPITVRASLIVQPVTVCCLALRSLLWFASETMRSSNLSF